MNMIKGPFARFLDEYEQMQETLEGMHHIIEEKKKRGRSKAATYASAMDDLQEAYKHLRVVALHVRHAQLKVY